MALHIGGSLQDWTIKHVTESAQTNGEHLARIQTWQALDLDMIMGMFPIIRQYSELSASLHINIVKCKISKNIATGVTIQNTHIIMHHVHVS